MEGKFSLASIFHCASQTLLVREDKCSLADVAYVRRNEADLKLTWFRNGCHLLA